MMTGLTRRALLPAALALALGAGSATAQTAQQPIELKLAYYVGDQHAMSQWLIKWAEKLEKDSGGRIKFKRFPGAQMGPVPQHYDFARTGQADISWFLHGATPGRFPLTGIVQVPYMVGSAEIGTKVLNDPELRSKYLDAEHKGVKLLLLFTHQPGNIHTTKKPIKSVDDIKGLRLRFASPEIRDFIAALGGSPVGVAPTEQVEQMQKGTLDGVVIDYGGAGIAFKMGGTVKHTTEMYSYVASFGLAMNEDTWKKLPPDLQQLITKSLVGVEKEIGQAWDGLDAPGKKALLDGGSEAIKLSPEENAKFRKIGADVAAAKVKELDGKGLPASAVHSMMKSLAEKHAKDSKNFWD
ncbi:TRAP transporter substrate-binding protein [Pseudorhodoplanes sp.]|uniref:TRAP transporter substrate-binding protein n=1 Tax=Pseudorhodoplanes sp. TaxID=1934341 RepID=UPI002B920FFB|nr:TRAP transporter substrate-binding protein [Pseudorhodoplanes sp.]HWV41350.1 TRAP transporter substrate-binding protein [Pseudorhodoplanes sp.]